MLLLVLACGLAPTVAGCTNGKESSPPGTSRSTSSSTSTTTRPKGNGTLVIGQLAPLTGPIAAIAPSFVAPVKLAADDMNITGGVLGNFVQVSVADDASTVAGGRAGFAQLVKAGADAIIGPSSSEIAADLVPELAKRHVVMCSGSNTAGALSTLESGGYYFRTAPGDGLQAQAMAELLRRDTRKRPVVVAPRDTYGQPFGRAIVRAVNRSGAHAGLVTFTSDTPAATTLQEALAGKPDAIVLVGYPDGTAPVIRSLVAAGKGPNAFPVYATDGLQDSELGAKVDPANPAVVAGLRGTTPAGVPARPGHPFYDRMLQAGIEPFFSASTYDCTILVGLAAVAAHSDDATAIRDHFAGNLRGAKSCDAFATCAGLLAAGKTIHYSGASSDFAHWKGFEPGSGTFDVWVMGLDARPAVQPDSQQISVG